MAEIVLTPVIQKLVDVAADFIIEEGSRLSRLRVDMNWLGSQLKHMQAYTAVAEAKRVTDPQITTLIEQIRDLAYDVEDTLDEFVPKIQSYRSRGFIRKSVGILSYGLTCKNFASEIQKIRTRVEAIDKDRTTYGIQDTVVTTERNVSGPRNVALHVDDQQPVGLDKDIDILKGKLLRENEKFLFVSVVGMGGVGKTTLVKKVFENVKGEFDCSASVSISQQPNFKDIFEDIAKKVRVPDEQQKKISKPDLYAFLQEKRYVLFLDDIWNEETWNELKDGFPINNCGSRIIITSRSDVVGGYIGSERYLHPLDPLDFQTSWSLFEKLIISSLTGGDQILKDSLGEIGKEIVRECSGIPLAIVVTVGMLCTKKSTEVEWKKVLKNIRHDNQCSQILELSYKDLPSPLKSCFVYFGVFPEDYEINVSELIRLWMAEKFIGGSEPEDVGDTKVDELISRNLVQVVSRKYDGRVQSIRIHDLLHSLCINIAKKANFLHTITHDNPTASFDNRICRLVVHKAFTLDKPIPRARTLHSFNVQEEISRRKLKKLLSNRRRLQVLSITGNDGIFLDSCQPNYLKLYVLEGKISKQNLKYLQTLDLRRCILIQCSIPSALWKMKQLRHLFLDMLIDIERLSPCSRVAISLPNVRTLFGVKFEDLYFIGPDTFPNLRKFKLYGHLAEQLFGLEPLSLDLETLHLSAWKSQYEIATETLNLSRYNKLKKLGIWSIEIQQLPGVDHFPPNLLKLELYGIQLEEDPMQVLKKLPALKILELKGGSYVGRKLDCSGADSFPQLELLRISLLDNLEELTDGEERGMHKLREFKILFCPQLKAYPEWLKQLEID